MCPTLFKLPWLGLPIRGYGLMLMIAFLGGAWPPVSKQILI